MLPDLLNTALNIATLAVLAVGVVYLRRLNSRARFAHGVRTHVATLYGMAETLRQQNQRLPLEVRISLYAGMAEHAECALELLDEQLTPMIAGALRPSGRSSVSTLTEPATD